MRIDLEKNVNDIQHMFINSVFFRELMIIIVILPILLLVFLLVECTLRVNVAREKYAHLCFLKFLWRNIIFIKFLMQ